MVSTTPQRLFDCCDPVVRDQADLTLGSRWLGRGDYVANRRRRLAMRLLARMVRWQTGGVFTDTTSGFRALGPATLELFARSYPTDFPEVESIVLASRAGLRVKEIPIKMTERKHGHSSIAGIRGLYYMIRVALALLLCGPVASRDHEGVCSLASRQSRIFRSRRPCGPAALTPRASCGALVIRKRNDGVPSARRFHYICSIGSPRS